MANPNPLFLTGTGLTFRHTKALSKEHRRVLVDLIRFVRENYSEIVNYDHLETEVKRSPIPMDKDGKRYDLAFVMGEKIVLIQIDAYRPNVTFKLGR